MLVERTIDGLHSHLLSILGGQALPAESPTLDIGCGSGAWLSRLKTAGWTHLVGIDYAMPEPVSGMQFRRFDINVDAFESLGQFRVITCIEVIEHIENVGRLLDLIQGALAADGIALVTTPNIESLRARTRAVLRGKIASFDEKSDPTHLMPILRDSLHKMLDRRGMQIREVRQYPFDRRQTLQYRQGIRVIARLLGYALPDELYGDNTIYLISHRMPT